LAIIRDRLVARQSAQQRIPETITARLVELRHGLNTAIVQALADLLDTDTDLLVAVMASYAHPLSAITGAANDGLSRYEDPAEFLEHMRFAVGERVLDVGEFLEALAAIAAARSINTGAAIAAASDVPLVVECLRRLAKTLFLLSRFDLSRDEVGLLLKQPDIFGLHNSSLLNPSSADLTRLHRFVQLKHAQSDENGRLAQALLADKDAFVDRLSALTNWPATAIRLLADHPGIGGIPSDLLVLGRLLRAFALAETLGAGVQELVALAATADQSFAFYRRQATVLLDLLRARYDERQWPQVYRPIHDRLALRKRDSLTAAALEQIIQILSDRKRDSLTAAALERIAQILSDRKRPDILYEYLLLDVQMGSETETSRIAQGIASLQLYVERCLMNLEERVRPEQIPADEWRWMKNYRVWEANRKVFVYPENYIEPELRNTRTPLFQDLMDELQQNDVNADSVTIAYRHYLDKFAEVANLTIAGSYLHTDEQAPEHPDATHASTLYLVGRNERTGELYFRTAAVEEPAPPATGHRLIWQPWPKIDLTISADFVSPVFAFNRLYLFWAELQENVRAENRIYAGVRKNQEIDQLGLPIDRAAGECPISKPDKKSGNAPYIIDKHETIQKVNVPFYKPTIKYSFHNFSKSWTPPQALLGPAQGWNVELNERERRTPRWHRVYAQRSLKVELKEHSLKRPDEQLDNVSVLELKPAPDDPSLIQQIPPFDTERITLSVLVRAKNLTPSDDDSLKTLPYRPKPCQLLSYANGALKLLLDTRVTELPGWTATAMVYERSLDTLRAACPIQASLANGLNDTSADPARAADILIAPASAVYGAQRELATAVEQCAREAANTLGNASATLQANRDDNGAQYAALWSARAQESMRAAELAANAAALAAKIAETANDASGKASEHTRSAEGHAKRATEAAQAAAEAAENKRQAAIAQSGAEAAKQQAQDNRDRSESDRAQWQAAADAATTEEDRRDKQAKADAAAELVKQYQGAVDQAERDIQNASETKQKQAEKEQAEAQTAGEEARATLAAAAAALDAADRAVTAAYIYEQQHTLKWKPAGSAIKLALGATTVQGDLEDDTWRQVALTLEWKSPGYAIWFYVDDQSPQGPFFVGTSLLPTSEQLVVGLANGDADTAMKIYLSELRVWNNLRDPDRQAEEMREPKPDEVLDETARVQQRAKVLAEEMRDRKLGNELGLFHMPLDETVDHANAELNVTRKYPPIDPQPDRERIIVAYGDIAQSLRSNFEDLSWSLKVSQSATDVRHIGIALRPSRATSATLFSDEAAAGSMLAYYVDSGDYSRDSKAGSFPLDRYDLDNKQALLAEPLPDGSALASAIAGQGRGAQPLLDNLTYHDVRILDIAGRSGWFILDAGDEEFLVTVEKNSWPFLTDDQKKNRPFPVEKRLRFEFGTTADGYVPTGRELLAIYLEPDPALSAGGTAEVKFKFERLNTFAVHALSDRLFADGIDGLLSLDSQNLEEPDFGKKVLSDAVIAPKNQQAHETIDNHIDFDGAYGMYYDEIFFHAPLLIANLLNANQRFAEAQRWYHYIFNPVAQEQDGTGAPASPNDRYWRFRRFRDLPQTPDELADMLADLTALDRYTKDPFDPHAIAALRMNAYQKAVVMKYIDNLIDWGDDLFRQDTREAINEATQLYVLAYTLLGPRPRARKARAFEQIGDLRSVQSKYGAATALPDFLLPNGGPVALPSAGHAFNPNIAIDVSFGVMENIQFVAYWDRVDDRLFKIRHSLNFDGVFRSLALYQPPLDASALVRAAALGMGGGLGVGAEALSIPVPHYRFEIMLAKAKEFAGVVTSLGAALLNDAREARRRGADLARAQSRACTAESDDRPQETPSRGRHAHNRGAGAEPRQRYAQLSAL
jgi:ABC toxin N-terminal region/Neuraminidase-like domain